MSEDVLNINVTIADRSYKMRVTKAEEESVRRSVKEINERLKSLQSQYRANDKQDYIAMAYLMDKVDSMSNETKIVNEDKALGTKLTELDALLSDFVAKD